MACRSWMLTGFAAMLYPSKSVSPTVMPGLMPAAGQPDREAMRVVVAAQEGRAAAGLVHRRSAKLASPDHQRVLEQPAPLEVRQQGRDRPVDFLALLGQVLDDVVAGTRAVAIPSPVEELNVAHPSLEQPAGQQAVIGERRRPGLAPYSSRIRAGSWRMSITSGTAICIRKASSYWLIRVSVSGSPNSASSYSLSFRSASSVRRRSPRSIPLGSLT